jgi:hypothetical protein
MFKYKWKSGGQSLEEVMETLLIVLVVLFLFGGGGYYGYRRWR